MSQEFLLLFHDKFHENRSSHLIVLKCEVILVSGCINIFFNIFYRVARSVKAAIEASGAKSDAVVKLKQVLGVSPPDDQLLSYWMSSFC